VDTTLNIVPTTCNEVSSSSRIVTGSQMTATSKLFDFMSDTTVHNAGDVA